jgi:hypothetical protein
MKKRVVIGISMVLVLGLAACGGSGSTTTGANSSSTGQASTASKLSTSYTGALPAVTQLAAGTLSLEGSELAVSAEQAAALLPLWQAYRALSQSDTTAAAELEALTNQIIETMTPAQVEAIKGMELTQEDLASLMGKLGLRPAVAADATPGARFAQGEGFPQGFAGGPPAGAPGAGGQFVPGGLDGSGGQAVVINPNATPQAGRTARTGGNRMTLFLIDPLITLLEARAGGTPQP